jgi:hypothetical protein
MEYFFKIITLPSLALVFFVFIVQMSKIYRFSKFLKYYPNESFDKLIEYEKKSKNDYSSISKKKYET